MPDSVLDGLSVSERESTWRRVLARHPAQPERVVLVVEEHGTLVGFCSGGPPRDRDLPEGSAEVYAIYVEPVLVGTGLGRILMAHAEEDLASRGYLLAVLWVLDGNARARRFYERAGWRTDGASKTEEVEGALATEVRYRKELRLARWS